FTALQNSTQQEDAPTSAAHQPLVVQLSQLAPAPHPSAAATPPAAHHPKPRPAPRRAAPIARPQPSTDGPAIAVAPAADSSVVPPTDMMSMINAGRERRRAAEEAAAQENAEA